MKINISKLRNRTIDATVKVLNKAKADLNDCDPHAPQLLNSC